MSAQIPSSQHDNYVVLQPSPSTVIAPAHQVQNMAADVHICGSCSLQFTDIKVFMDHKTQGCQNTTAGSLVPQPQAPPPTQPHPCITTTGPTHVVGMPVGVPHVILQPVPGPPGPQMYRIVLETNMTPPLQSSVPSQVPIHQQTISTLASARGPHQTTQPVITYGPTPALQQQQEQEQQQQQQQPQQQQQQHLLVQDSDGNQVTPVISGNLNRSTGINNSTILQLGRSWDTSGTIETSSSECIEGENRQGNDSAAQGVSVVGESSEGGMSSNMHTEEEDVATFLATQFASQAAPGHNTHMVTEPLISSAINVITSSSPHVHYTSAPTQVVNQVVNQADLQQQQQQQLPQQVSHQQHPIQQEQQASLGSNHTGQMINYRETSHTNPRITQASKRGGHRKMSKVNVRDLQTNITSMKVEVSEESKHQNNNRDSEVLPRNKGKEKTCPVENCNFVALYLKDMNRHMRTHTGEKPFICAECGKAFSRTDKLSLHRRIHTNVKPYWCTEPGCNYRTVDSGSLKKHTRVHTDERPYWCQMCSYKARDGSQLTVHLRTHTGDTPFHCMEEGCSAAFKTSSDLHRHTRLHTGLKPFKCAICDYACAIKSNLTVHMKLNHFDGAKFGCSRCSFVGNSRKHLKEHEKMHSAVIFQCQVCDYTCISNTSLKQHMMVHSDEKPFQCRYCSFTCRTTGNLRYHMRNKHGQYSSGRERSGGGQKSEGGKASRGGGVKASCCRSFKCKECSSSFVREDSYRSHVRQHKKHKMAQGLAQANNAPQPGSDHDILNVIVPNAEMMTIEQVEVTSAQAEEINQLETNDQGQQDPLQMEQTVEQVVETTAEGESSGSVDVYNYVITINGIPTVFPNPVRLPNGTITTETGEELGTVQVISGALTTTTQNPMSDHQKVVTVQTQPPHSLFEGSSGVTNMHIGPSSGFVQGTLNEQQPQQQHTSHVEYQHQTEHASETSKQAPQGQNIVSSKTMSSTAL